MLSPNISLGFKSSPVSDFDFAHAGHVQATQEYAQVSLLVELIDLAEGFLKGCASIWSVQVENTSLKGREELEGCLEGRAKGRGRVVARFDGEDSGSGITRQNHALWIILDGALTWYRLWRPSVGSASRATAVRYY